MKCAAHPSVETGLKCGKCEKPICPRCLVMTPVGARCKECAAVRPLPVYDVSPVYYLRAVGAGLGGAIGIGLVWYFISLFSSHFFFGLLQILPAMGAGYLLGIIISRAVNRKRGRWLAVIGGGSFLLCYSIYTFLWTGGLLATSMLFSWIGGLWELAALVIGGYFTVDKLR